MGSAQRGGVLQDIRLARSGASQCREELAVGSASGTGSAGGLAGACQPAAPLLTPLVVLGAHAVAAALVRVRRRLPRHYPTQRLFAIPVGVALIGLG
jgi:hypothetical protein